LTKESFVDSLSERLTRSEPAPLVPRESAGVAVVFRVLEGEEQVLLIRRAERKDDPWSGQIAFPGGMANRTDKSFEETARRETAEEVGIDLSGTAVFLGYMREIKARTREIIVVPSVFKLEKPVDIAMSGEVASYEWVPLSKLARKEARSKYVHRRGEEEFAFPSLVHEDLIVWGLTERILSAIMDDSAEPGDDRVLGEVGRY
jgi:8-oxo-dGTP pyrophosphatase MutT (NUDIX family)